MGSSSGNVSVEISGGGVGRAHLARAVYAMHGAGSGSAEVILVDDVGKSLCSM